MTAPDTAALVAWIEAGRDIALDAGGDEWEAGERCVWGLTRSPTRTRPIVVDGDSGDGGVDGPAEATHIALHDPAHELAVYAAIRAVVELHQPRPAANDFGDDFLPDVCECGAPYPCPTLAPLASLADGGQGQ